MAGRHLPPDPAAGDPNTIGGYEAVHARPAAFEGRDGMSYSVSIEVDETGDPAAPWAAYFLFLRWKRLGAQGIEGHLETGYLEHGTDPQLVKRHLGAWSLTRVRALLDERIAESSTVPPGRRWWDVMRDEGT